MKAIEDLHRIAQVRDQFASAALVGMLSSWDRGNSGRVYDMDELASDAYLMADQMMRVRARKPEGE
jgi:hypothetical protein